MSAVLAGLFDQPGGALLEALLAATWKGALVVLVVLSVQALLGSRLPPRWRYGLWLLAAVRLLMPVGPPSPLSLFRVGAAGSGTPLPGLGDVPAAAGGAAAPVPPTGFAIGLAAAALGLWAIGLALIAARRGASGRHLRSLLAGARAIDDRDVRALLGRCRETVGVRRPVRLVESPALAAPALWPGGPSLAPVRAWAPAILLPAGRWRAWSDDDLRYVLLHELAHLRQGDGLARRVEALLTALHWFNPLVWLAARRARADCEPACDALVLSRLDGAERAGYGRALIRAAEGARTQLPLPGLVGMTDRNHLLRRRISMIARPLPLSARRVVALATLALLLAFASWTDVGVLASPSGDGAPADPGDMERQRSSVQRTRETGVAMFAWLEDLQESGTDVGLDNGEIEEETAELDWSRCPSISYDELAELLVPTYLSDLPRTDGWGHPFEFCLNRRRPGDPRYVAGIRSPGRDGRWEGNVYPIGRFDPEEMDRDLVWVDGFFITWPQRDQG